MNRSNPASMIRPPSTAPRVRLAAGIFWESHSVDEGAIQSTDQTAIDASALTTNNRMARIVPTTPRFQVTLSLRGTITVGADTPRDAILRRECCLSQDPRHVASLE